VQDPDTVSKNRKGLRLRKSRRTKHRKRKQISGRSQGDKRGENLRNIQKPYDDAWIVG
jgi:hypothetical protein